MTRAERRLARRRADETTRLYRWEDRMRLTGQLPYTLVCERTMVDLQLFTAEVWEKHGRAGWGMPKVRAWNGTYWKQYNREFRGWSYQLGRDIKLAKRHRNRMVLLHELVHAMGFSTHGAGFRRKYADLLVEYGGLDREWIELGMGMYGLTLPGPRSPDR